jgi:hypothetical protein
MHSRGSGMCGESRRLWLWLWRALRHYAKNLQSAQTVPLNLYFGWTRIFVCWLVGPFWFFLPKVSVGRSWPSCG